MGGGGGPLYSMATIIITTIALITGLGLITYIRSASGMGGRAGGHITLIYILISLEVILLAISLFFFIIGVLLDDIFGPFFSLIILALAGTESAIGLGLLIN